MTVIFILKFLLSLTVVYIQTLLFYNFSKYFFGRRSFTNMLMMICVLGSVISFTVSFFAALGKIIIYTFTIFSIIYCYKLYKINDLNFEFLKTKTVGFITLGFTIIFSLYIYYSFNFKFFYDGHDPYLFGIPFEISKADYFSRLRVFDNYPLVWSKYHFFHGSVQSIFLIFLTKNIFIYKFLKVYFVFLFLMALKENTSKRLFLVALFTFLTIFAPSFTWLSGSNGLLSLFLFLSFFYYFINNQKKLAILSILLLMGSSSRTLIPGIIPLFIVFLYSFRFLNFKNYLIYFLVSINLFVMVFSGQINKDYISLSSIGNINLNNFKSDWFDFLLINKLQNLLNQILTNYEFLIPYLILFGLILFSYCKSKSIVLLFINLTLYIISVKYYQLNDNLILIINFLTVLILIILQNIDVLTKRLLVIYFFFSTAQNLVIPPDSSVVNLMIFDVVIAFIIVKEIFTIKIFNKDTSLIALIFLVIPINFSLFSKRYIFPDKRSHTSYAFETNPELVKNISKKETEIYSYQNSSNKLEAVVNLCFFGKRMKYSENTQNSFSVSKQFSIIK